MIRLVVEQDDIVDTGDFFHELFYTLAVLVAAVIAPHDGHVADGCDAVSQQINSALLDEVYRLVDSRDVLVVTQTCYDGGFEAPQFFGSALFLQRAHNAVNQVSSDKNHVGVLAINHVHPASNLGTSIVESRMQVAHHDDFKRPFQWFLGYEVDFLALFILVVDITSDKGDQHHARQYD